MKDKHLIFAIHVTDRMQKVPDVQQLLSQYGCYIKTRIGLHDVGADYCSPGGVILLELFGDDAKCNELGNALDALDGIELQRVQFDHE